jgi:hypothetical protein
MKTIVAMRGHWRRFLSQIVILISMVAVASLDLRLYTNLVLLSIIVLLPVCWGAAAVLLWSSAQAPEIDSLSDRADDALSIAVNSTVAVILALLVIARALKIINEQVTTALTVGLGFIIVTSALPSIRFLQTWRSVWLGMIVQKARDQAEEELDDSRMGGPHDHGDRDGARNVPDRQRGAVGPVSADRGPDRGSPDHHGGAKRPDGR